MSITLAYDDVYARVVINASLPFASTALVERSVDQIRWTTVRSGAAAPVDGTTGAMTQVYDYEFAAGVPNYYRITANASVVVQDAFARTVAAGSLGSADTGQTYVLETPLATDYLVNGTRAVITPSGTTYRSAKVDLGAGKGTDVRVRFRFQLSALPPTNFWEVGADLRQTDVSNRYLPKLRITSAGVLSFLLNKIVGGVETTMATLPIGGTVAPGFDYMFQAEVTGPDTGNVVSAKVWLATSTEPATYTVTATTSAPPPASTGTRYGFVCDNDSSTFTSSLQVDDLQVIDLSPGTTPAASGSITPVLTAIWLKSPARPFLNQKVQVVLPTAFTVTRPARNDVNAIVGRSLPVGVTDVRGGQSYTLLIRTEAEDDTQTLEYLLASGDVVFLQKPGGLPRSVPGGYYAIGDATQTFHPLRTSRVLFSLPLTEVAAPGPYVTGAESGWASVLATYGSWPAVQAANPGWADLLARRGAPAEVIVP